MSGWATALCVGALLLCSAECMQAASEAAAVFCAAVLPALFPMSVLAALPRRDRSGKAGWGAVGAVLFGWAAGSPASMRRAAEEARAGRIDKRWLEPTVVAANVMSPMFFVGTLASWTGSARAGWRMLAVHLAAAALTGALCAALPRAAAAKGRGGKSESGPQPGSEANGQAAARQVSLPAAILSAAQGMLAVCGAMMLFSVADAALQAVLARLAPAWTARNAPALAALHALLEIGGGARRVTLAFARPLAPLCALCGFGGLSLWTQTLAFAGACARPARLLCWRAVHGALSYAICLLWEAIDPLPIGAAAAFAALRPATVGFPALPLILLALLPAFWRRSKTCWPRS